MRKENNKRRFPGESCRNRPDRAAERRAAANDRQDISDGLSPQQRLDNLDATFGVGMGATKERAKLLARMSSVTTKPSVKMSETPALPNEVMQEIAELNEEVGGKKRLKAKERRARANKEH